MSRLRRRGRPDEPARPGRLLVLAALALAFFAPELVAEAAGAPTVLAEIATRCRARELRLVPAGSATLLLWRDGGGERGDAKKGCKGQQQAGWLTAEGFRPLPAGLLTGETEAASLPGDQVLLTWAENGTIRASTLPAGSSQPSPPFTVSVEEPPSQVAAPFPLARPGGGFLIVYESDFFSGRRRNAVWRAFRAPGEPTGETLPAFADFISIREPVAALTTNGRVAVAGPGIGPVAEGYFFQLWGADGDPLHEPLALEDRAPMLGAALATAGDTVVFAWSLRAGKGQEKAFLRLYSSDGRPLGPARELGATAGTPALASGPGGRVRLAFLEPGPTGNRIQLLEIEAQGPAAASRPGPETPAGAHELALDPAGHLAWAEAERIVLIRLP